MSKIIKTYEGFISMKTDDKHNERDDNKKKVISVVIDKLKEIDDFPVDKDLLKSLIDHLRKVNIKPVDIIAAYKTDDPKLQKQYLIDGPSAPGGGGSGALKDLTKMLGS